MLYWLVYRRIGEFIVVYSFFSLFGLSPPHRVLGLRPGLRLPGALLVLRGRGGPPGASLPVPLFGSSPRLRCCWYFLGSSPRLRCCWYFLGLSPRLRCRLHWDGGIRHSLGRRPKTDLLLHVSSHKYICRHLLSLLFGW